jgi:Skp family chaperone for outer membrane proteins
MTKRQKEFESKQKEASDLQEKLRTGDKALNEATKAEYTKKIETLGTEMNRINEDAQRDLGELQQQLFSPIMARVTNVVKAYATENGFAVVFDIASQSSNIIHYSEIADITTEIIRRLDAEAPKAPASPAAPGPGAPARPSPTTPPRPAPAP